MIFLVKPATPPEVLKDNYEEWTRNLLQAVSEYGGYRKVPKQLKANLIANYRHEDIKNTLFAMSNKKCAFCESKPAESGNIEVEHFIPKSEYPHLTFDWGNFLPVCRKCNESKGALDTLKEPIVNPTKVNPEDFFKFNDIRICIREGAQDRDIAQRTVRELGLNNPRLLKARAELLIHLSSYIESLNKWFEEIESSETPRKRHNRIRNLRDSIESIEMLIEPTEKYTAFSRDFIKDSEEYKRAKMIVDEELIGQ
ncbi:TIGR02646 family protein [Bacillus mycoides]|uniref:retron system putative HNH endonuclease n=1 Tax=Bacillus mycoides TaxID=1405 RepID=UPI001C031772|nr:retron system putative HNH endonuclease [Bacillus mycoides]MCQ6536172.1 TIGR02646 family protein [Bacillus mycoides]QWI14467.1 TIGR02646 family protein [Bacillus mycoides]